MDLTGLLVVSHALVGAVFLGALIGRWIVLGLAERASSLESMRLLATAARPFERIVIVGSMAVFVLGLVVTFAQGRPLLGPLQGAPIDWLFASLLLFLTIGPLVPLVFIPRGKVFEAALADAIAAGTVTPALRTAWRDPIVRGAHVYELLAVTLIFVLMIAKPF